MNRVREYLNILHNEAWTNHLKKLGQGRENTRVSAPVTESHVRINHGYSKQSRWGK